MVMQNLGAKAGGGVVGAAVNKLHYGLYEGSEWAEFT